MAEMGLLFVADLCNRWFRSGHRELRQILDDTLVHSSHINTVTPEDGLEISQQSSNQKRSQRSWSVLL